MGANVVGLQFVISESILKCYNSCAQARHYCSFQLLGVKETICLVTDQRFKVKAKGLGLQLLILLLGAKKTIASQSPVCPVATSSLKTKCEQLVCKENNYLWVSSCPAVVAEQQLPKVEANGVGMQSRHALLPRATTWTDDMMMMMMIQIRHALVPQATTWTDDMRMIMRRLPCYHSDG